MQEITIHSVKLKSITKGGGYTLDLKATYQMPHGDKPVGPLAHTLPVHKDLENRIQQLGGHYAVMIDRIDEREFTQPQANTTKKLESIFVSGYSLGGDKVPNIVITGHFINYRGKACIVNTPVENLVETQNSYAHMAHLLKCIEFIEDEVIKYVKGEKYGEVQNPPEEKGKLKQTELNMEGNSYPNGPTDASPEAMQRVMADVDKPNKRGRKQTADNPGGEA